MDRLIRPVSRQLLRPRLRYPFSIPPPPAAKRLYTMGHDKPDVSEIFARLNEKHYTDLPGSIAQRQVALH
jgi:hypothetical protein